MTQDTPTPIRKPRRRASRTGSASSITGQLRTQLAARIKEPKRCHECGSLTGGKAQTAREIGISVISLNKFLDGGVVNSDTVDAVGAYLNKS